VQQVERLLERDVVATELVRVIRAGGVTVDMERLRGKVAARLGDGTSRANVPARSPAVRPFSRRYGAWSWGVAAAVAIAGIWTVTRSMTHAPVVVATKSYAAVVGRRTLLTLGDGTRIMLAPSSSLRVTEYSDHSRVATLDGEAYFNVTPVANASFTVVAGGARARVLGTAFTVQHYRTDRNVRVAVVSGKVSVTGANAHYSSILLTAGRVGDITDSSAVVSTPADMAPYSGWVDDQLVFHNAPAPEVLAALSRWYGYEFRFADSTLVLRHLTAGISTESSKEALATLKILLHVDMTFDGSIVTLIPRASRVTPPAPKNGADPIRADRAREVGR